MTIATRCWLDQLQFGSMNGQVAAFGQANYSASKGGIIAFTRTAALELLKSNITVNVIAPGYTETDMFERVPRDIQAQIKAKIPGRASMPRPVPAWRRTRSRVVGGALTSARDETL